MTEPPLLLHDMGGKDRVLYLPYGTNLPLDRTKVHVFMNPTDPGWFVPLLDDRGRYELPSSLREAQAIMERFNSLPKTRLLPPTEVNLLLWVFYQMEWLVIPKGPRGSGKTKAKP